MDNQDQLFPDAIAFPALMGADIIYAAVFLWLGHRGFVRLELKGTQSEAVAAGAGAWTSRLPVAHLFQCSPTGRILNLIRKEIRLQYPVFQLAAMFVACWLATVVLQWLRPRQNLLYLFDILPFVYAPISGLLAGSVSLGEEKALGLSLSQLVLPVSPKLQWLVKLGVGAVTAVLFSLGLPFLLFRATQALAGLGAIGSPTANADAMLALASISGLMFVLGHWAISLTGNTVRAALVAVAGLIGFTACGIVGVACAQMWADWTRRDAHESTALIVSAAVAVVLILGQSLIQFCRSEERERKLFLYSLTLAALIVSVSFLATCVG